MGDDGEFQGQRVRVQVHHKTGEYYDNVDPTSMTSLTSLGVNLSPDTYPAVPSQVEDNAPVVAADADKEALTS